VTFWAAYRRGLVSLPLVPATILLSGMIGFGAFARQAGFGPLQAVLISAFVWALPGQVMLVDQLPQAGIAAAFLAVTLTSVRLLPMTVVLAPLLRGAALTGLVARIMPVIAVHFVALTLWVEGQRVLPTVEERLRLPLFLGWSSTFFVLTPFATGLGYYLAGTLPPAMAAVLLFLTPLYFGLTMVPAARRSRADAAAVLAGAALGPVMAKLVPGFDLVLVGLLAGALFLVMERRL
jgi:predicted branched-subunit amino acid permease